MILERNFRLTIYHSTRLNILFPSQSHGLKLKVKQDRLKVQIIRYRMLDRLQLMGQLVDH